MNYEQTDVVFVIEKSISLKRYLNELLETYITPAVSFFSGGINEENDVYFTQSSLVQYALVFYGSELTVLGSSNQLETKGPTTSQLYVLNAIKDANYCYKNTCRQAYILEALQTATEVFKSLAGGNIQKDSTKRCLVLITQSAPINNPWATATPESILQDLKMIGVKTSIISAHKLVELYKLFESAGGDHASITMKNYAAKPQHLVLLSGFTLQERPVSPSLINQSSAVGVTAPAGQMGHLNASTGPSPIPTASHNRPSPSPVQSHTGSPAAPQQTPNQMIRSPAVMNSVQTSQPIPNQPIPPGMIRAQVQNPQVMANPGANMGMNTRPNRWPMGNNSMLVQNSQGNMQQVPQQSQAQNTQMAQGNAGQMQPVQVISGGMQPIQGISGGMTNQMNPLINQPRTMAQNIIWQGTIEWSERKSTGGGSNTVQKIPCKISSTQINGKPEIKTDGWPSVLQMLLVQKNLLSSVGNTFFQNIYKVMFCPEHCPALESLTASLNQGFAGCVHLSSSCSDVKMMVLLYSLEKRTYVGFIPFEQTAFVNKIKQVFQNQSRNMSALNKQNVAGNMIQGVNPQVGVSTQNMQMLQNPSGMNVSQSNIMMQQQSQMNQSMAQQAGMAGGNSMVSGVSQVGSNQVTQIGPTQGQGMPMGQSQQMNMGTHVSQGGPLGSQMPSNQVMGNKLIRPINIGGQQPGEQMTIRQPMHQAQNIRQIQLQPQRSTMQIGQARMRHLLQQRMQHQQQQQQHQQQHQQMLMIQQQQGLRPQMNQAQQVMGQQVMGQQGMGQQGMGQQGIPQQGMGQQAIGQQSMGQQTLNQGMGQPMQDNATDYLDLL